VYDGAVFEIKKEISVSLEIVRNFVLKSCMLTWRRESSMSISKMSSLIVAAASIALTFGVAGCNKTPTQDNSAQSQPASAQTDQTQDPQAAANLAPADNQQDQNYSSNDSNGDYDAGDEDTSYGQPVLQAQQAPPQLPEYSQPDCPGDGYLWTPGYWSYSDQGLLLGTGRMGAAA
jgi:hypothetical protein